jgi:hypothetical protein
MQTKVPGIAVLDARLSLTSISQRPTPFHMFSRSSVGHIRGLIKLKTLSNVIQNTRRAAAKLRDFRCVIRGGKQSTTENPARVGRRIEAKGLSVEDSWDVDWSIFHKDCKKTQVVVSAAGLVLRGARIE